MRTDLGDFSSVTYTQWEAYIALPLHDGRGPEHPNTVGVSLNLDLLLAEMAHGEPEK